MKTNKFIRTVILLTLAALVAFSAAACGNSDSGSSNVNTSSGSAALYTVNGAEITDVSVVMVGSTPNMQIVFSNKTDKDIEVDFSKLTLKLADGTEIGNLGLTRTIEAGKTRTQIAVTVEEKYGIKLGDTVEVYYGADRIKTVEVEEF